jgi:hypothetical protein
MKKLFMNKFVLTAAVLVGAVSASQAGGLDLRLGINLPLPRLPLPVVVSHRAAVCAPAPVYQPAPVCAPPVCDTTVVVAPPVCAPRVVVSAPICAPRIVEHYESARVYGHYDHDRYGHDHYAYRGHDDRRGDGRGHDGWRR